MARVRLAPGQGVFFFAREEIMSFMEKMLREMRERVMKNIEAAGATDALEQIRVAALGKKGELTALLRGMGKLPPEERPKMGQMVNEVRAALEQQLEAREKLLAEKEKAARLAEIGRAHV